MTGLPLQGRNSPRIALAPEASIHGSNMPNIYAAKAGGEMYGVEKGSVHPFWGDRLIIDKHVRSRSYSIARQRQLDIRSDICTHV